jgi:Histidine kinase-, DNA gyrase B-, and HSP90-like ATPase
MRRRTSEVIPSARRLIGSLRDVGYELATAVADLIDNSVAAEAESVWVDLHFDGEDSWLRVADDGWGMTEGELHEAMRFGTRRAYSPEELGKFGLGLKAASLSQCRVLTVATRTTPRGRVRLARWDLDHIEQTDRWEILRPTPRQCRLATDALPEVGTVVLWQGLDRISRYRVPDGRRAEADFERVRSELEAHLGMAFHRFLSGESVRRVPLTILLNDREIAPWDPFARGEAATIRLPMQRLRLGPRQIVEVRPYVLPTEARFSSTGAHRRAAGPAFWNRQQGLYIYRADRMIQSGGWSRLRTSDEHTKLARVSVDLPAGADELFELNVSKSQVRIPAGLRPELAAIASSVTRIAKDVYSEPASGAALAAGPSADEQRAQAVRALVRMVLAATEDVVREELARSGLDRERVLKRLRKMERDFLADLSMSSEHPAGEEDLAEAGAG